VLLHVLNDALGSVVVVVASVLFYIWPIPEGAPCDWKCYIDPSLTLVMVVIILSSAIPLIKETTSILLQMSPPDMTVSAILVDVCLLPGVISVHEVHVWELVKDRNVATLHVKVNPDFPESQFKTLHAQIREVFHKAGIHSVTAQLEFCDDDLDSGQCSTPCMSTSCLKLSCCPEETKSALSQKANQSSSSGEVSINMADGTKSLLRERDVKKSEGDLSQVTKF
ncbi:hypothetical protein NFI96_017994, partial [Prochilodus magdalenae]